MLLLCFEVFGNLCAFGNYRWHDGHRYNRAHVQYGDLRVLRGGTAACYSFGN